MSEHDEELLEHSGVLEITFEVCEKGETVSDVLKATNYTAITPAVLYNYHEGMSVHDCKSRYFHPTLKGEVLAAWGDYPCVGYIDYPMERERLIYINLRREKA